LKFTRKFGLFIATIAIIVLVSTAVFASTGLGISGPCYPVLSPTGSVSNVSVTWWDKSEVTAASVRYSTTVNFADTQGASYATATATLSHSDDSNDYAVFEAEMTGLSANTTYYYQVGHDAVWSEEYSFSKGSANDDSISFMYMGDVQYNEYATAEADYAAWGSLLQGACTAFPDLDFALLGGDMVQNGNTAAHWQMFLNQATKGFSSLPVLPIPGNHESNSATTGKPVLFLKMFRLPENGPGNFSEEFYSYDYGNVHVTCLSSTVLANEQVLKGGMQESDYEVIKSWIANDLQASDATWKVVVMHHPAYAVVSDDVATQVLAEWEPIFVDQQVDLVLCGHQHIYMRTKAIKGVTYVMGNSGSKHYAPATVSYAKAMIADVSTYQIIEAGDEELALNTYDATGASLDSVTLTAKDRSITPVWPDPVLGDVNEDGYVDQTDLDLVMGAILNYSAYDSIMDLNGDGKVDISDAHKLSLLISQ
jgi:hypothetical protein